MLFVFFFETNQRVNYCPVCQLNYYVGSCMLNVIIEEIYFVTWLWAALATFHWFVLRRFVWVVSSQNKEKVASSGVFYEFANWNLSHLTGFAGWIHNAQLLMLTTFVFASQRWFGMHWNRQLHLRRVAESPGKGQLHENTERSEWCWRPDVCCLGGERRLDISEFSFFVLDRCLPWVSTTLRGCDHGLGKLGPV